ncbi:family 20 glycosylhydrolase [Saccharothrix deserti]|uniref:family 20 glycosylhydrolase n=1 Tax=Saccharothrix deserti TaxID=2593674 RepID=UPI003B75CD27
MKLAGVLAVLVVVFGATVVWNAGSDTTTASAAEPLQSLVPVPVSVQPAAGVTADSPTDGIALLIGGAPAAVGDQGYHLVITAASVQIRANTQAGPWTLPGATITDYPRFGHRSAMLDVARHFHPVDTVKRYLDQLEPRRVRQRRARVRRPRRGSSTVDGSGRDARPHRLMAFPRLPAIAELGWSPWSTHDRDAFRVRLAAQAPRWSALGIAHHRSPQVPWPQPSP